jgi:membrane protein implicated in regulation of membrane protease activity
MLLMLPADHVIADIAGFRAAVLRVVPLRRSRPADHLRHRADRAGNRLRLHQGRRAVGRLRFRGAPWSVSSKNPISPPLRLT